MYWHPAQRCAPGGRGRKRVCMDVPRRVQVHGLAASFLEHKARLGAIQGLDLTLLIAGENDGMFGRREVEAHHVFELLLEAFVAGEFEGFDPVRFQTIGRPEASHARRADTDFPRHRCPAPMGRSRRFARQRQLEKARSLRGRQRRDATEPALILEKARQSPPAIALPAASNLPRILPQLPRDLLILQTLSGQQNHGRPFSCTKGTRPSLLYPFQLSVEVRAKQDSGQTKQDKLFHPRRDRWSDHFAWNPDATTVVGLTAIGRATIEALSLNRKGLINQRKRFYKSDKYPPK